MESIIDHVGINVTSFDKIKAMYNAALAPLGITLLREYPGVGGWGRGQKPEFWIGANSEHPVARAHVCLKANSRGEVDAFYEAALAAGFRDNGGPGVRPEYHQNYYGAFVLDPDGHNIEAVFHG
ncbi:MAG TPA: VOC family protein [Polyangiaceae bacterium]|nr:VOC family protein [Polyangiaceae bacterium]